jgi:hypothetical protein
MAAGTFKVTAKTRRDRRNTTKLSSRATLFALAALAAMLFSAFFFVNTSKDGTDANNGQAPAHNFTSNPMPPAPPRTTEQAREAYGQLPMSFEANRGQADESVNFVARGAGYTLALSPTEATFALSRPSADKSSGGESSPGGLDDRGAARRARRETRAPDAPRSQPPPAVLRMNLVGANRAATVAGQNELEGKVNYFIGNDPAKWRTDVPTFGRVRYAEVYPGIDVVYYGNQRRLEYDFVVAPGRDAREIALEFAGAQKVEVDAETGDLLVHVGEETIRQHAPVTYQEVAGGGRREVESRYALRDGGRVEFEVGEYDTSAPLIIDPVLVYSTYLGTSEIDAGFSIAVDSAGNAYVTGYTHSTNFPTASAVQGTHGGGVSDAFVTKLNAAGSALVYSTYLGGSSDVDEGIDIAVDSAGNAYVIGTTFSTNFPTAGAIQGTYGGGNNDAFVVKLNASGSALVYSTYLGGISSDVGREIAVDSAGNAYVTGVTTSTNFPTANPIDGTLNSNDAFVTKLNASGSALVYSTYLGGSSGFEEASGIAVDSAGNAYVTGFTFSTNFPTASPFQGTNGGGNYDAFITKINAAGSALVYSTYLGGISSDVGREIAVDSAGNAYVTGYTGSTNFPTASAIQGTYGGAFDAFVTKINAAGSALVYSTYLGGSGEDVGFGIAVDSAGNAYVTGYTTSTNFPTASAIQGTNGGGADGFVTKINAAGSALDYSTYLGGSSSDFPSGIAVDSAGNAYVAGSTVSTCFPTTTGAFDTSYNGGDFDAFISKISETGPPTTITPATSTFQFAQATYTTAEDVNFVTVTVTRTGDTSSPAAVDFSTSDGTASERSDYTTALGTLRFAAGETSKTFDLLINEDSYVEGQETFTVALSNPTVGACLGTPSTATVQITDDASEPSTNVIDDAGTFVGTHYHDFLNRQADASGLAFWTSQITSCGSDAACIDNKRTNVSQAFFLSIEFQQTGYLVFRIYKETYTDSPARPRGMPRYREFLRDTQEVGQGVVVGVGNWEQQLEANKQAFAERWVQKTDFLSEFPLNMTAEQFVDKLFQNSEVTPTQTERNAAIAAFGVGNVQGRAAALRNVADSGSVYNRQFNPAFVLMQYIGYLRRNPNNAPDGNYAGFDFWLTKMNNHSLPGEDVRNEQVARARVQRAEMVRAFIISGEYRGRFGP